MQNDYLSLFQSQLLRDKLATDWKKPNNELLPILMSYAQVPPEGKVIVEAFMISWKLNHPDGKLPERKMVSRAVENGNTFEQVQAAEYEGIAKSNKRVREPGAGSIIEQILTLYKAGKTRKEIIAAGYNKSTVARQCGEYDKRKGAGG